MYGHDVYYCPRTLISVDNIFNEDRISEYNQAFYVEMYLKDVQGFEGEGTFLSKFNIQLRDEFTFCISNRVFANEIGMLTGLKRPREGDLIYMPLTDKIYVIKYAEHEPHTFYQLGGLYFFDLKAEKYEYSNERLNTGVAQIDRFQNQFSLNTGDLDANNNVIIDPGTGRASNGSTYSPDVRSDDENFQIGANTFLDFTERNPFANGDY